MSEDNVTSMADKLNDGRYNSPEQLLKTIMKDMGPDGPVKGAKMLVAILDDSSGDYEFSWYQCGMKMSECISLCEVAKTRFLRQMHFIADGYDVN